MVALLCAVGIALPEIGEPVLETAGFGAVVAGIGALGTAELGATELGGVKPGEAELGTVELGAVELGAGAAELGAGAVELEAGAVELGPIVLWEVAGGGCDSSSLSSNTSTSSFLAPCVLELEDKLLGPRSGELGSELTPVGSHLILVQVPSGCTSTSDSSSPNCDRTSLQN